MGDNRLFFIEPDGGAPGLGWLYNITSFVDNMRYLCVPGSLAIQEAFGCMSKFTGALVLWLARGSNSNNNHRLPGDHLHSRSRCTNSSIHVKYISSVKGDLTGFFLKSKIRWKSSIPTVGKISSFALKQMCKEIERLQSFPLLSLAAALVPPFTNFSSNFVAVPMVTSSVEAQRCIDKIPCEIENRECEPCIDHHLQSIEWSNKVEPRTGIEFPALLENTISVERSSSPAPEVLVGTGSRTVTVIRIKSLKVYAFGFYVHPVDVREKLGPKYACIQEDDLENNQDFYQDLLREDINMTVRLVVSCNGITINTVKDAFEKSLRARITRANPDADFSCLQTFGSIFSPDIPLHMGTTFNFRRTTDGCLITEVGGNSLGSVQSKDLCTAFFDMYIGDTPVCKQTKEEIGKNVASILRMR